MIPIPALGLRAWLFIAAAIAVAAVVGWSRWQVNSLRADLAEARGEAFACAAAVDMQNQAVSAWKAEADRRARIAQDARSKAAEYQRLAEKRKRSLYALPLTGDECEDLRLVVDAARADWLWPYPAP